MQYKITDNISQLELLSSATLGKLLLYCHSNIELSTLLISMGASLDIQDYMGNTILHLAVKTQNLRLFNLIIDNIPNIDATNLYQETPLHLASQSNNNYIINALLEFGADIHKRDIFNRTPLHLAAHNYNTPIVDILLLHGADRNIQLYHNGPTAWDLSTPIIKKTCSHLMPN